MKRLTLTLALSLLCGCAAVSVKQTDLSDETTQTRTITTTVKARTLFAGAQTLDKLNAYQTDSRQGVGVGAIGQLQSTNNALDNLVRLIELLRR